MRKTACCLLLLLGGLSRADEPRLPERGTYRSAGGSRELLIVPASVRAREENGRRRLQTTLELKDVKSGQTLWSAQTPMDDPEALVADVGDWVILWIWARDLKQPNAVELYGPGGKLVRAFSVGDLVSPEEAKGIRHSVSHVTWGSPKRFDAERQEVVLHILRGGNVPPIYEHPAPLERRIDLRTGKVVR